MKDKTIYFVKDKTIYFILHFLGLVGNESLSNVEARKKEVKLAGIAIKEAKEKSC